MTYLSDICHGCLVTLDDVLLSNDDGRIPVWCESAVNGVFVQMDYVSFSEVFLVLSISCQHSGVEILTPRGNPGMVWIGSLRAV